MQNVLKATLISAIGFIMGYQFSKDKGILSKIEVGILAKSEAKQKFDQIFSNDKTPRQSANDSCHQETTAISEKALSNISLYDLFSVLNEKHAKILALESQLNPSIQDATISKEEAKEAYFDVMANAMTVAKRWKAVTEMDIAGEQTPMLLYLEFYSTDGKVETSDNTCWNLGMILNPNESEKLAKVEFTGCMHPTRKDGTYYLSHSAYPDTKLNKAFALMLFPIPQDSENHFLFLPASADDWQKGVAISWEPITIEQAEELASNYKLQVEDSSP